MAKDLIKGIFVTFEGPEGCGKSTHSGRIVEELLRDGFKAVHTAEPGGTPIGKSLREILLEREDMVLDPVAELLLFEADRAQHVKEFIRPLLAEGNIVICDRFNMATFAYQGYGLGLDMGCIMAIDNTATGGVGPDLTIVFDIEVEKGLERALRGRDSDKMEKRGLEFHRRVREGYLDLYRKSAGNMCLIDSSGDIEDVYGKVKAAVYGLIGRYKRTI